MKHLLLQVFFTIFVLFFSFSEIVLSADLKAPIDLSSAKVLPKGVRNLRFKGVLMGANHKFNNAGSSDILADPFFKKLTWNDLLDPKTDPTGKGALKGYLKAQGWNLNEDVGSTTGALSVDARAQVPILAYGITNKITMAVAVPIVRYKFNVDTSFIATANANKMANQLKADKKIFELAEFQEKMANPAGTKASDFNYKPLVSEQGTKLGDIKVLSKYSLSQKEQYALTLQPEVTLPTGKTADINKIVDVGPGDGQWDTGLSILTDWYPLDRLTVSTSVGYIWQIKDKTAKRIPYTQDSTLSPDIDENVSRDLGDQVLGQVGAKYEMLKGFTMNTGYTFQWKEKDRYSGNAFEEDRYDWLEAKTEQRVHTAQVGVGYTTLRLFQEKAFPVPVEANLTFTKPLAGKNVTKDTVTALELAMFF